MKYYKHKSSGEIARVFENDTWQYYSKERCQWEPNFMYTDKWSESLFVAYKEVTEIDEKEAFIEIL